MKTARINARDLECGYTLWHTLSVIKCKNVKCVTNDSTFYENKLNGDSLPLWSGANDPLNTAILDKQIKVYKNFWLTAGIYIALICPFSRPILVCAIPNGNLVIQARGCRWQLFCIRQG